MNFLRRLIGVGEQVDPEINKIHEDLSEWYMRDVMSFFSTYERLALNVSIFDVHKGIRGLISHDFVVLQTYKEYVVNADNYLRSVKRGKIYVDSTYYAEIKYQENIEKYNLIIGRYYRDIKTTMDRLHNLVKTEPYYDKKYEYDATKNKIIDDIIVTDVTIEMAEHEKRLYEFIDSDEYRDIFQGTFFLDSKVNVSDIKTKFNQCLDLLSSLQNTKQELLVKLNLKTTLTECHPSELLVSLERLCDHLSI